MAERATDREAVVAAAAAQVIARLDRRLPDVARRTQRVLVAELPELSDDPPLMQLLLDTVTANIETVFESIRNDIPLDHLEPPSTAQEYARRLAQRGVPANALVRAYRIGHRVVLDIVLHEIRGGDTDPALLLDVVEWLTALTFHYVDWISQQVIGTYSDERDRWQESRNNVRAAQVRDLLAGAEVDLDAATAAIRYPLRRTHLALAAWWPTRDRAKSYAAGPAEDDGTAPIERFVERAAGAIGSRDRPLCLPADRLTVWAWIPLTDDAATTASARLRALLDATPQAPAIATGRPLPGVDGFRRSHRQALDARMVALAAPAPHGIDASEPGVLLAGLLGADLDAARRWTGEVLGPLATDTEADARLRETLRVFLRAGSSFKAASDELHLHFNTVRYRVRRAVERRGREIDDDRLDVEVALLLCHRLGAAVLG